MTLLTHTYTLICLVGTDNLAIFDKGVLFILSRIHIWLPFKAIR
jgi:hypothetical protein